MKIYINSRGKRQDYHWHKILAKKEEPVFDFQNNTIERFSNLINEEKFSILLTFINDELILFITALEPENYRVDSSGTSRRIIRNSLLLISSFSDEHIFRLITISALRGELRQKLEDIIEFDEDAGFKVTANRDNLLNQLMPEVTIGSSATNPEKQSIIKLLSNETKEQLANELQRYSLPKKLGILVVITKRASESDLRNKEVWRGLTPYMTPLLAPVKKNRSQLQSINNLIELVKRNFNIKFFLVIAIISMLFFGGLKFIPGIFNSAFEEKVETTISISRALIIKPKQPLTLQVNEPFTIEGSFVRSQKKKITIT